VEGGRSVTGFGAAVVLTPEFGLVWLISPVDKKETVKKGSSSLHFTVNIIIRLTEA
jgi:hypothetical protein